MKILLRAFALGLLLFVAACESPGGHASDAATVNGVNISRAAWQKVVDGSVRSLELRGIPMDARTPDGRRRRDASELAALRELIREEVYQQVGREKHLSVTDAEVDQAIKDLDATLGGHAALEAKLDSAGQTDSDLRHLLYVNSLRLKLRQADPKFEASLTARLKAGNIQAYVGPCATSHNWPQCSGADP